MKARVTMSAVVVAMLGMAAGITRAEDTKVAQSPLDYTVKDIDGKDVDLAQYKGKVVMLVNVASKCGYTPQYTQLEKVYEQYKDKGFVIVGFPANNFKSQEPGTNDEIKQFCTSKYNVTFPMMAKVSVKGDDQAPVYKTLTGEPAGEFKGDVKWNFTKFLVGKDGKIVARFEPKVKPDDEQVTKAIEKALAGDARASAK